MSQIVVVRLIPKYTPQNYAQSRSAVAWGFASLFGLTFHCSSFNHLQHLVFGKVNTVGSFIQAHCAMSFTHTNAKSVCL